MWKPGDATPNGYLLSRDDGLPARNQGPWARDKLKFLEQYITPALGATKRKRGHTHFVDLFAGPGRNVSTDAGYHQEFDGSPIRALRAAFRGKDGEERFGVLHFCNLTALDDWLLKQRVEQTLREHEISELRDRIKYYLVDSNEHIAKILASIPSFAYLMVFADIEGPQDLHFETIRQLRKRHDSVDLYVLFPVGLGRDRLLSCKPEKILDYKHIFDRYFGTMEWRSIVEERTTSSQAHEMHRRLRELYMRQLRQLWKQVDVAMRITKARHHKMYDMLFAYDHDAAGRIAKSARRRTDELGLFNGMGETALGD